MVSSTLSREVTGVRALGEALHHLGQRVECLLGDGLVAADIGDLLVVAERLQIVGVGDVLVARMELNEPVERDQRVVVLVRLVVGEGGHDLRLGRPYRIGMLAVDFLEFLGSLLVVLGTQIIERAIVELVDRLLDIGRIVVLATEPAATGKHRRHRQQRRRPVCLAQQRLHHDPSVNTLCRRVISRDGQKKRGRRPLKDAWMTTQFRVSLPGGAGKRESADRHRPEWASAGLKDRG